MASFLSELQKFDHRKLQKTCTKAINWGEVYAQDKDYWTRRSDLQEVIPHLFITSYRGACNKELLLQAKMTHVLIAASHLEKKFPESFVYKQINILDLPDEPISSYFEEVFQWMEEAIDKNGNVLVHCNAGISRSASFIIGYLMVTQKISYKEAFNLLQSKRSCISPNRGFIRQLKILEKEQSCNPSIPSSLESSDVISTSLELSELPTHSLSVLSSPITSKEQEFKYVAESDELISLEPPPFDDLIPPPPPLASTPASSVELMKSVKTITPRDRCYSSPFSCSWEGPCDHNPEKDNDELESTDFDRNGTRSISVHTEKRVSRATSTNNDDSDLFREKLRFNDGDDEEEEALENETFQDGAKTKPSPSQLLLERLCQEIGKDSLSYESSSTTTSPTLSSLEILSITEKQEFDALESPSRRTIFSLC